MQYVVEFEGFRILFREFPAGGHSAHIKSVAPRLQGAQNGRVTFGVDAGSRVSLQIQCGIHDAAPRFAITPVSCEHGVVKRDHTRHVLPKDSTACRHLLWGGLVQSPTHYSSVAGESHGWKVDTLSGAHPTIVFMIAQRQVHDDTVRWADLRDIHAYMGRYILSNGYVEDIVQPIQRPERQRV